MGTTSSKEAEQTVVPGVYNPIIGYKKSIYGWGKLTHPVRKYKVPNTKKKRKTTIANLAPIPMVPESQISQNLDKSVAQPKVPKQKVTISSGPSTNENSAPNPWKSQHEKQSSHFNPSSESRFQNCALFRQSQTVKSPTPIDSKIPTTQKNTSTFYGKYRCSKCKKYWVSGQSQNGVAQNCRGCRTPTYPMT